MSNDKDLENLLTNVSNEKDRKALREAYEAGKKAATKKPIINSTFVTSKLK